jgi:transposase
LDGGRNEVISLEKWQTIRHLKSVGVSKREIAKLVRVARSTVDAALAGDDPPGYRRGCPAQDLVEPYREMLRIGLDRGQAGVTLLRDVRKAGYAGSRTSFYVFLTRPKAELQPWYRRFETGPGEQAQFDWSPYTLPVGGVPTSVIIYGTVLGYSRRVHWLPSLAENQEAVLEGIGAGLRHFGGACRFLVIDNARAMVLRHRGADLRYNETFLAFCGHYRIEPIAATPVHPETKGKIENPFESLDIHVLRGNSWTDFDQLEQAIAAVEAEWEQRIHGTTRVPP